MFLKILAGLFFCLVIRFISHAQDKEQKVKYESLVGSINRILQNQVDSNLIPGAVIEIKSGSEILCKKAFGYAAKYDYHNQLLIHPENMTTDHLFDIASLTKVIGTTTSIMLLVDRGLIQVDDLVGKYIPAFNGQDKKSISIRHLLTHTAGLYEWYPLYYRAKNKMETYTLIGHLPLKYSVGEQRHYSDLGFVILGEIIETVSGLPLDRFMDQNIFRPLEMHKTIYNPNKFGRFNKIVSSSHGNPYERRMVYDSSLGFVFKEIHPEQWNGWRSYTLHGEVNDGNAWYANDGISGAAGLFSTVEDLQKLVDILMNKGKKGSIQFISAKTIELFLTKDHFQNGLGWMMDYENSFMKDAPSGTYGHTGFTGTSIVVLPSCNISVILLINRQNKGLLKTGEYYNLGPLRQQIFNAILNYCQKS